jgi:perosamine synthetase
MPVHLYGQVCDMSELMAIAREHDLGVLEDCAECYLGTHKGGLAGAIGDVGSWSFENSKHLTTGDGGIVACDDEELARRIRKFCGQGYRNITAASGQVRLSKDIFQDPGYRRHDSFGFMYRLPEVAAALGLAQLEKLDWFVEKREAAARAFAEAAAGCSWLQPQQTPPGDRNTYWAFALRYLRDDVPWQAFRRKFMEFGGDGIYAAWALGYQEDCIADVRRYLTPLGLNDRFVTEPGICPNAERIQPQLMQFTTNQKDEVEVAAQAEALARTIRYYS